MPENVEDIETDGHGNVLRRVVHAPDSAAYKARRCARIDGELADIDRKLDRNREEMWTAIQAIATAVGAGNVIPAAKREMMDRKAALRQERRSLE